VRSPGGGSLLIGSIGPPLRFVFDLSGGDRILVLMFMPSKLRPAGPRDKTALNKNEIETTESDAYARTGLSGGLVSPKHGVSKLAQTVWTWWRRPAKRSSLLYRLRPPALGVGYLGLAAGCADSVTVTLIAQRVGGWRLTGFSARGYAGVHEFGSW
jgi:hypothetical protein